MDNFNLMNFTYIEVIIFSSSRFLLTVPCHELFESLTSSFLEVF